MPYIKYNIIIDIKLIYYYIREYIFVEGIVAEKRNYLMLAEIIKSLYYEFKSLEYKFIIKYFRRLRIKLGRI